MASANRRRFTMSNLLVLLGGKNRAASAKTSAVSRLPDKCLVALFKQLPPKDQLTARQVCRKWATLVNVATQTRRALNILVGHDSMNRIIISSGRVGEFEDSLDGWLFGLPDTLSLAMLQHDAPLFHSAPLTQWNSLLYGQLDAEAVEQLATTFPAIQHLQLAIVGAPQSQLLCSIYLLKKWQHQLTSVNLFEDLEQCASEQNTDRFFAALNSLSILADLKLNLYQLSHRDLTIISQLKKLHFNCRRASPSDFADMLLKVVYDGNTSLGIEYRKGGHGCGSQEEEQFISLSDVLCQKISQLGLYSSPMRQLASPSHRSLTSLSLAPLNVTPRCLFTHLSEMNHLVDLGLHLNFFYLPADDQSHLPLPQLRSVKAIKLTADTLRSHCELEKLNLNWTVPNLESMQLYLASHLPCTNCTIEHGKPSSIQAHLDRAHCLFQISRLLNRQSVQLQAFVLDWDSIPAVEKEDLLALANCRLKKTQKKKSFRKAFRMLRAFFQLLKFSA